MLVKIQPNSKTSKKLKERLKEHGEEWTLLRDAAYNDKPAILVESTFNPSYLRWFMKDEVEITYE